MVSNTSIFLLAFDFFSYSNPRHWAAQFASVDWIPFSGQAIRTREIVRDNFFTSHVLTKPTSRSASIACRASPYTAIVLHFSFSGHDSKLKHIRYSQRIVYFRVLKKIKFYVIFIRILACQILYLYIKNNHNDIIGERGRMDGLFPWAVKLFVRACSS